MDQALYKSMDIPIEYYIIALPLILVTGLVCFCKERNVLVSAAWAFLVGYVFLIFSSTVLAREVKAEYDYDFRLFWSYIAIKDGRQDILFLNIANVLMLMPVGFFIGGIGVAGCVKAAFIGVGISGVIEFFQLILKRGMFEFDDIVHNTLGCVLGYLIYRMFKWIRERIGSK